MRRRMIPCLCCLVALTVLPFVGAQTVVPAQSGRNPLVGDSPAEEPALAKDVSPRLTRKDIGYAMKKVGDWQLAKAETGFDRDWTFAALYVGYMAVPEEVAGGTYRNAMLRMGERFAFQPGMRVLHADDQAVSQTYLELYARTHDAKMLQPTQERMDAEMRTEDDPQKPLWWWCDALFMAPDVLAKVAKETGDPRYLAFMDREWWITSGLLYNTHAHLYARDATFLDKHEKNGQSIYWSRGNGWVFAGLARVLTDMPTNYPDRPKYVAQFKEMAAAIAAVQGADGLWRPGLLDAADYPLPEVSGSEFFTYGFAWGMRNGLLDRKVYQPVAEKAWAGMVSHIYADGRLGDIQQVGAAPDAFKRTSSYVYGVGAFLLAGSEVYKAAR